MKAVGTTVVALDYRGKGVDEFDLKTRGTYVYTCAGAASRVSPARYRW